MAKSAKKDKRALWENIREQLGAQGIDLDQICDFDTVKKGQVKLVCLTSGMKDSKREIDAATRDKVVMVRVDDETNQALDAWVETGAVKSRSEAAALFIREGLKVRSSELQQLHDVIRDVEVARSRLREKARSILGEEEPGVSSD
jgi:hypothetical protein